ncbi:MAG: translocation/assembly module TamB domain-containing protein, partial [Candidatus Margulisbacteria bacterium]|nr:translocation/assembly module TamB domain-containing protein [Candidatus Margulisiibacteriota bacterium]
MKKAILLVVLGSAVILTCAFSLPNWPDSLYEKIRSETIKGLQYNFKREIKIGRAEGVVLGQMVFHAVVFPGFAKAEKVTVNYNLAKFALARDIVPAISKISIENAEFLVERDARDKWNILSLLPPPDPKAPPPPEFRAKLIFKNCRVKYNDQIGFRAPKQAFAAEASQVSGVINFQKKNKILFSLAGQINDPTSSAVLKLGGFYDFTSGKYELNLVADKIDLVKWGNYMVSVPNPPFEDGSAQVHFTLVPAQISGKVNVRDGSAYLQKFAGEINFSFADSNLTLDFNQLSFYKGQTAGRCQIAFRPKKIVLDLKAQINRLDLVLLSQNTPGITGLANGSLSLSGPVNNLAGSVSANLVKAALFGQPIDQLQVSFAVKESDFQINKLRASAPNALVTATGKISREMVFDLQTKAQGIHLSGQGLLGKMEAMVDQFEGKTHFKLDDKFLVSPLKNLTASGKCQVSQCQIGQQRIGSAQGNITIGEGLIRVENAALKEKDSILHISGQTGIGAPTYLKIHGEKLDLADFKIVNHFLPREAQDPSGLLNASIIITGELSKETLLTSLEPLLSLNFSTEALLFAANIADVPISSGNFHLNWENQNLVLSSSQINFLNHDYLAANFSLNDKNQLDGNIHGVFDASVLNRFIKKYGALSGKAGINAIIGGTLDDPDMAASFWIESLNYNSVFFDLIEGNLFLTDGLLYCRQPIAFAHGNNRYELAGSVDLSRLQTGRPEKTGLNLQLNIPQADLYDILIFANELQFNLLKALPQGTDAKKQTIDLVKLTVPNPQQFTKGNKLKLYAKNGDKNYFLRSYEKSIAGIKIAEEARFDERIGGSLSGKFALSGEAGNLSGKFQAEVKDGFIRDFKFEKLGAEARLADQTVAINKFEIEKRGGKIRAAGSIGFNGALSFGIIAKDMPLDFANIYFNKDFQGRFDLNASVEGFAANPSYTLSAAANNASLAGVNCDKALLSVTKDGQRLVIDNISIIQGGSKSILQGEIDLSPAGKIDLSANIKNDAIGLFNLFTDDVHWNSGKALAKLKIGGTTAKADIDGSITLKDGNVYVKAIDSNIKNISGNIALSNGTVDIKNLGGIWQGKTSGDGSNYLGITGSIDISRLLSVNSAAAFDLAFSPSNLYVKLPNLYSGLIWVQEARLKGPLNFDYSTGPTISGRARLSEATIALPSFTSSKSSAQKPFPLNLDLTVALDKNVNVSLGGTNLDLSYLFMNLEIKSDELKLGGSLAGPSILGKIDLKRGTINIFSREFSLLSPDEQKQFYLYEPDKIKENFAEFLGGEGTEGSLPKIAITSRVDVENSEKDTSGQVTKKKVVVLSYMSGIIGSTDQARGLNIAFSSFTEDKTKSPIEMVPASYSEQDIKLMLLPDFIKSLAGVSGDTASANTNAVIADYLASRLQTAVFRGMESKLEQALGLESLSLDYNFGKDLRQSMGITDVSLLQQEKPDWRVSAAKGFFDRFYIDVMYAQYSQEMLKTGLYNSFNYQ